MGSHFMGDEFILPAPEPIRIKVRGTVPVARVDLIRDNYFFFQAEDGIRDADVTGVQTCALPIFQDEILSDKAFHFKPELLVHLAPEHWLDSGIGLGESYQYPLLQYVSSLQRFVVSQFLGPQSLQSVQEVSLHAEPGKTLEMSEIFRALTDSIWKELTPADAAKTKVAVSAIRRNLQREHVARLV